MQQVKLALILFTFSFYAFNLWAEPSADLISSGSEQEREKEVFRLTFSYLMESGRYQEAQALVSGALKKSPQDQELHRQQGLLLYAQGKYPEAEMAFTRAAELTEGRELSINLYLQAKTRLRKKDPKGAEEMLRKMAAIPESSTYSAVAIGELAATGDIPDYVPGDNLQREKTESPAPSTGTAAASGNSVLLAAMFGYDTNPVFIPDYSQTRNNARSTFYSVSPTVGVRSSTRIGEVSNAFNLGYTGYTNQVARPFNNLRVSLGTSLDPKADFFKSRRISFSNTLMQSYQTFQKIDYYFTSDTLMARKELGNLGANQFAAALNLGYRTYANKNLIDAADDRSGFSYGLRGTHKLALGDWVWMNSTSALKQKTFGGKFDTLTLDVVTNLQKILPGDFELMLGGGLSSIDYVNSDQGRKDTMTSLGADLGHDIPNVRGLATRLSYVRTSNSSKIRDFTYTQNIYSLWLTYEF